MFFKKNKNENNNLSKVAALLIHAAKIDEIYTESEKNLVKDFIKSYLHHSSLPTDEKSVRDMMVDCEINTIVAFPGLLANIYDAEIPLLRGIDHPTAKSGYIAQSSKASPIA